MEYFARRNSNRLFIFNILRGMGGGGGTGDLHRFVPEMVRTEDPEKISFW
jgi:hypothetical protein